MLTFGCIVRTSFNFLAHLSDRGQVYYTSSDAFGPITLAQQIFAHAIINFSQGIGGTMDIRSTKIIPTLIRGIIIVGLVWSDGQNFMQPIIFATLVASDITDSIVILLLQFTYFTAAEPWK